MAPKYRGDIFSSPCSHWRIPVPLPGARRTSGTSQEREGPWCCYSLSIEARTVWTPFAVFCKPPITLNPYARVTSTPQPPARAINPGICSSQWAPCDAWLGKQMQKKPVGSSNIDLKIELVIHPCLACKIYPKLSPCLCFLPPHTFSKTLTLAV